MEYFRNIPSILRCYVGVMAKNGTTELSSQYFWPRTGHIQVISIFGHLYAHTDTYENNNIINTIIV